MIERTLSYLIPMLAAACMPEPPPGYYDTEGPPGDTDADSDADTDTDTDADTDRDGWLAVDGGAQYSCSLHIDGGIDCWGDDSCGQSSVPEAVYSDLDVGRYHTCAITADQAVVCWGRNDSGEASTPAGTFLQVTTGYQYSCAIGTNESIQCWGDDTYHQLRAPAVNFQQVDAGYYHACGLTVDGEVDCWGNDGSGQATPPPGTFVMLTSGTAHSCALAEAGSVECWGLNDDGQTDVPEGSFTFIEAGNYFTCGVLADHTVTCWGSNDYNETDPPTGSFSSLGAGAFHTCGVTTDGGLNCWGYNSHGQAVPPGSCRSPWFKGEEHRVLLPEGDNILGLENAFTIAAWVWMDASMTGALRTFLDLEASMSSAPERNSGIYLGASAAGNPQFFFGTGVDDSSATWTVGTNGTIETEQWVHVVATRDEGAVGLYLDGDQVHSDTTLPTGDLSWDAGEYETDVNQLARFDRGALDTHDHLNLVGGLAQVAVWSRALSMAELGQVLAGEPGDVPENLEAWWPLDDGWGLAVEDLSSNSHDGQLFPESDGPTWTETCP